ncbi:HAD hydrolase family protein, partial [Enterococcus faecium]|uniref:HAD hydrolase family protein n=1 Tax=Enterococcus faecium TaxID=1352 RepID=UPI00316FB2D8
MIKLVAIDLDGTLLNSQKEISLRNKQALMDAKQAGVKVVICPLRSLAAIGPYLEELGLQDDCDYSITFNGKLVQKNDTGVIIQKTFMPLEAIHELYPLASTLNMPFDVLSDEVVM